MKVRRSILALGLVLSLFVFVTSARASEVPADFSLGGTTSIAFDGTTLTLTTPIIGAYNPAADDFTIPSQGTLTLTTGAYTSKSATQIDFSGGTFTLSGTFNGNPSATLLSGALGTSSIFTLPSGKYSYTIASGALTATTISGNVSSFYWGYTAPEAVGGFNVGFSTKGSLDLSNEFSLRPLASGDIQVNPVPIPGGFALLGPALAGLAIVRKRFRG